jgi:L-asparaginase
MGAMLVMNNQINAARDVAKTHTYSGETFKSGDYGFLGEVRPPRRGQHPISPQRPAVAVRQIK